MISAKNFKKKKWKFFFILCLFSLIFFLSYFLEGAYENYSPRKNELRITKSLHYPLREVSGMYLQHSHTNPQRLYAVGDHDPQIASILIDTDTEEIRSDEIIDFGESIIDRFAVCKSPRIVECKKMVSHLTSQWEGITADGFGNIFLLHEQLASIFVYNLEAKNITTVINLEFFDPTKDTRRKALHTIAHEANALGEGLVVLKNGHILVVRERFQQPAILEFGKKGDTPLGYNEGMMENHPQMPEGTKISMEPIKEWLLPKEFKQCDLSEINWDANGSLYLLSQKCQIIAKLKNLDPEDKRLEFEMTWSVPRKIAAPEAFVVLEPSKRFLIGEDRKSSKAPNFYFLHADEQLLSQR